MYESSAVIMFYRNKPVGLAKFSINPHVKLTNSLANVLNFFISSVGIERAIYINSFLTN